MALCGNNQSVLNFQLTSYEKLVNNHHMKMKKENMVDNE